MCGRDGARFAETFLGGTPPPGWGKFPENPARTRPRARSGPRKAPRISLDAYSRRGWRGSRGRGKATGRKGCRQPERACPPGTPQSNPAIPALPASAGRWDRARACSRTPPLCSHPCAIGWSRSGLFEVAELTCDETSYAISRFAGKGTRSAWTSSSASLGGCPKKNQQPLCEGGCLE